MTASGITRRRALVILASAAATAMPGAARAGARRPFEWRGTALGADARLLLWARDRREARGAINACVAEIERLERIFSLYRAESEISQLNRAGALEAPSHDMVRLLSASREMNRETQGLFDPTVQPLWELYAGWYGKDTHRGPPPGDAVAAARSRVGLARVRADADRIRCEGGARLTFNGIAQGYITDRVAELLKRRGWRHVLIDLGEVRALDARPDGAPWRIALEESGLALPLADGALATSAGAALPLAASGEVTHIFDPATGLSPALWRAVSVRHASATVADALSTALFCAPPARIERIAAATGGARVWATRMDGTTVEYGA